MFLVRFGLFLIALLVAQFLTAHARAPRVVARSALVDSMAQPVRIVGAPPHSRNTPLRDIYVIVLDGHANARVLADMFQYDASPFEDSLRALGFLVPRDMRSNYVQTYLSVASLLNAAHVTRLTDDAGVTSTDHTLPTYLVKHNRVARFLKQQGYKYLLFPSAWWAPTKDSPLADEVFDADTGSSFADIVRRTELRRAVLASTLLHLVLKPEREPVPMVRQIVGSFEGLHEVPADPAPTFTFVHILLPHAPYLLDAQCQPLAHPIADDMQEDNPEQRADYIGQVRCVDGLLLDAVTAILRRSSTPPVILVVGDHGSGFSDLGFYAHPESVPPAFIRERFGAFGAFHLPAGGDSLFREPVTLVNVLGNVLRYYFGADLPESANDMYVSGQELFRFYRVDPEQHAAP
jgi:Sulfatase